MQEKERQEPFYKVYRKDCGRGLNPKELLIISLVKSYEDDSKKFFMSNEYISKEIGLCKRTVQKTINELVGKGELFKKEVRDNARGQANCIRILSTKPIKEGVSIACGSNKPSAENAYGNTEPSAENAYGNTEPSAENAYGNTEPSADFAQKRMQKLQEAYAEIAPYNNSYNKNYYKKSENTKNRSTDLNKLTPEEKEKTLKEALENMNYRHDEDFY